jgi:hypothetical protein
VGRPGRGLSCYRQKVHSSTCLGSVSPPSSPSFLLSGHETDASSVVPALAADRMISATLWQSGTLVLLIPIANIGFRCLLTSHASFLSRAVYHRRLVHRRSASDSKGDDTRVSRPELRRWRRRGRCHYSKRTSDPSLDSTKEHPRYLNAGIP